MSFRQTISYDTPSNFTYSTALIEVLTSAKLKDIRPAHSTFYAGFLNTINAQYGDGVLTATAVGNPQIVNEYLDLTGNTLKYLKFDGVGNVSATPQTGCVRFTIAPGYSGSPGTIQTFWVEKKDLSEANYNNEIEISHQINGQLNVAIFDQNKSAILVTNFGAFSPVAGTDYEIELDFDLTAGATRLFINGIQLGSTSISTGTRSTNIGIIIIGTDDSLIMNANFKIKNAIRFNTVQHTSNFASEIPRKPEIQYSNEDPGIINISGVITTALEGFSENVILPANTDIKYQISRDGDLVYWNGSAWVASDGTYAQSSTAVEILTNEDSLDISDGATLLVRAVLHSAYGDATPTLISNEINYEFFVPVPEQPNPCIVFCFLEDILGNAITEVSDAKLFALNKLPFVNGGFIVGATDKKSVDFDARGYAEIQLTETESVGKTYDFFITYKDGSSVKTISMPNVTVPNQQSADLISLITLP